MQRNPHIKIEDKFAFIESDIFRSKRSTDASFIIFDVSPSIQKASSEITSAHSNDVIYKLSYINVILYKLYRLSI